MHSGIQKNKRFFLTLLIVCIIFIPLFFNSQTAKAFDATQRSWVTLEIPVLAENNILVRLIAVTSGNNLNQSIMIVEPTSTYSEVTVTVSRAVVQAEYSTDSNVTTFTYILAPNQYTIQKNDDFPSDKYDITIHFTTSFNSTFDARTKYCLTPSPYYYGNYTTLGQGGDNVVNLKILHPASFPSFAYQIFYPPIFILFILWLACTILASICLIFQAYRWRKNLPNTSRLTFSRFQGSFITICSAAIFFIPVFELSTQQLNTPLQPTVFDKYFVWLLSAFVGLLIFTLIVKLVTQTKDSTKETQKKFDNKKTPKNRDLTVESILSNDSWGCLGISQECTIVLFASLWV
jgi:hypothetical protein